MWEFLKLIVSGTKTFAPYQNATTNVAKIAGAMGTKLPFEAYTTLTKTMHDVGKVSKTILEVAKK